MNKQRKRLREFGMEEEYLNWKRSTFPDFEDVDAILSGIYSKKGSRRSKQDGVYYGVSYTSSPRYYQPEHFIRTGTQKEQILSMLKQGDTTFGQITRGYRGSRNDLLSLSFSLRELISINPQNAGMYLRRMEYADIVERPKRGLYRLTKKGKKVLYEVDKYGHWGWPK